MEMNGLKEATAQNMIKYIYTGSINDVKIDTVSDHLNLASTLKLKQRGQLVQKRLINSLDPSNCIKPNRDSLRPSYSQDQGTSKEHNHEQPERSCHP